MPSNTKIPNLSQNSVSDNLDNIACDICRPLRIQKCNGHLKLGSSGGGSGGGGEKPLKKNNNEPNKPKSIHSNLMNDPNWNYDPAKDKFIFDVKDAPLLLELHNNGKFSIISKYSVLETDKQDVKNYTNIILNELEVFKQMLQQQGISTQNITETQLGNALIITFDSKNKFDGFIQHLIDKNILPVNAMLMKEENTRSPEATRSMPSPFKTRPRPLGAVD